MSNKLKLLLFLFPMISLIIGCGINPPTQDLEKAKASIAKLEEVEAAKYASKEFDEAKKYCAAGEKLIVPGQSEKNVNAKKYLNAANNRAKMAYDKSAPQYTDGKIKELEVAVSKAKEIKADVAVKDLFNQANNLLIEAKENYNSKDYENSWKKAVQGKPIAENAYQTAADKRNKSENAIKEAEEIMGNMKK